MSGRQDASLAEHTSRVDVVADAVRTVGLSGSQAHIDKGGVHHVVPLPADRRFASRRIDASTLTNIVWIDSEARRCRAEPGVSFETVVRATLPMGLAPTVVPELRGITLGGAVAGCSIESMSFRHGGFHDSCIEYEVIGGDGAVRTLRRDDDTAPLFEAIHGSYGTLGLLTSITFELIPAKPYVEMTYERFTDLSAFEAALLAASSPDDRPGGPDFVDGIIHAPDHLTLCLGRWADTPSRAPSSYEGEHIYYRSTAELTSDVMTAEQYFFRYDAECHWLTKSVPLLEWRWVRRLLGRRLLGSTNLITWANRLSPVLKRMSRRPDVVCDVFIPAHNLAEFWSWYVEVFDFWPLWVVPYRPASVYPWLGNRVREEFEACPLFIDLAVYGKRNNRRDRDYSVLLEDKTYELRGIKTLIGRNHYTRERFWEVYDRSTYEAAKAQLDPGSLFPDLYDKLGRVE